MTARRIRCPACGREVSGDSRFCLYCGKELPKEKKIKPAETELTCPVCGKKAEQGTQFCLHCGAPLQKTSPSHSVRPASVKKAQDAFRLAASTAAGEMDFGDMGTIISAVRESSVSAVTEAVADSPIAGILHCAGSWLGGLFRMFTKPKVLLYSLMMAGLWTILGFLKDSGSELIETLSWLTCAEGGILGKGCTAVFLSTLFSGGIVNTFRGIGSLFRKEGKGSLFGTLFGLMAGAACCLGFTGAAASASMAGISGALLSLQSLGRKDGKLYTLAESLTSGKADGIRIAHTGKAKSLLTGLSLGFAVVTFLVAAGV